MPLDSDTVVYRLSDYIHAWEKMDITNDKLYLKDVIETTDYENNTRNLIVLDKSIVDKYRPEFAKWLIRVQMTDREKQKYFYNPKMLCFDLYGDTEYWRLILDINQMYSVSQFCNEVIYIFDTTIIQAIAEILALEENTINENKQELTNALLIK